MSSLSHAHDETEGLRPAAGTAADAAAARTDEVAPRGVRPDVALLQRAQKGDRGAYGQVILLYQDRLFNAVLRMVGDREEARELTQEAFTRGLMKLEGFRGDASPYTWLFRIAVNLAISQLRKVQRTRVFSLDRPASSSGGRNHDPDQAATLMDRMATDEGDQPPVRPSVASATRRCWRRWAASTPNTAPCW